MTVLPIVPSSDSAGDCHAEWKKPAGRAAPPSTSPRCARASRPARVSSTGRASSRSPSTPEFEEMLHREFPRFAAEWPDGVSRRNFLQLAAASLGSRRPDRLHAPADRADRAVRQPARGADPGPAALLRHRDAVGRARRAAPGREPRGPPDEGRRESRASAEPRQLDRASRRRRCSASTIPDRSQAVTHLGRISRLDEAQKALTAAMTACAATEGAGLRLLTGPTSSPTEAQARRRDRSRRYPKARWHRWDPLGADARTPARCRRFGRAGRDRASTSPRPTSCPALETDFLAAGPARCATRASSPRAAARRARRQPEMNRLYVVESSPTPTGTMADHRLALRPSAAGRRRRRRSPPRSACRVPSLRPGSTQKASQLVAAAARDLAAHRGALAGRRRRLAARPRRTPLVARDQRASSATPARRSSTASRSRPSRSTASPRSPSSPTTCAPAGSSCCIVSGVNPVYDAPSDLDFAGGAQPGDDAPHPSRPLRRRDRRALPVAPAGGALPRGVRRRRAPPTARSTLVQPLIEPLYGGKSLLELLGGCSAGRGDDAGRTTWCASGGRRALRRRSFRKALHDGFVAGQRSGAGRGRGRGELSAAGARSRRCRRRRRARARAAPDPSVLDGRFANNGWLQELPKPITKLTWDNALLLSPRTAEKLGVANEQLVEVAVGRPQAHRRRPGSLPGQADERRDRSTSATAAAAPAGSPTASASTPTRSRPRRRAGARRRRSRATRRHAAARLHAGPLLDRDLARGRDRARRRSAHVVRDATLEEFAPNPNVDPARSSTSELDTDASFAPGYTYNGYKWGMAIDLNACTGCNACVIACQSENNIPVVGKEQVRARPRDALDPHRPLLPGRPRRAASDRQPADRLHAVRAGAVRDRLPGGRDRRTPPKA